MAVVLCQDNDRFEMTHTSHLAVSDLSTRPSRLLYYLPLEPVPEGIEFSPDGSKLFVSINLAHHIAVFDVSGFMLKRSPIVLHTGTGPASLAIGPHLFTDGDVTRGISPFSRF